MILCCWWLFWDYELFAGEQQWWYNDGGQDDDDDKLGPMFMNIFKDIVSVSSTISVISDNSTGILTADCCSRLTHTRGSIID